jgi:hypothetical protein
MAAAQETTQETTEETQTGIGLLSTFEFKLGGYIKLDAIHDFDPIRNHDLFVTNTIPVGDSLASEFKGRTHLHARETRLILEATTNTSLGKLKLYVSTDFLGVGSTLRLRQAYGKWGNLLAGRSLTAFYDRRAVMHTLEFAIPNDVVSIETLDLQGPNSLSFVFASLIRWSQRISPRFVWNVAIEDPRADVTAPSGIVGEPVNRYPDLTTSIRYNSPRANWYLAGVLREVGFVGTNGYDDEVVAWGLNLVSRFRAFRKGGVGFKFAFGKGIGRYIQDLQGTGSDAAPDTSGALVALPAWGGGIGYRHWWSNTARSNVMYNVVDVDNSAGQTDNAFQRTQYVAVNLIWSPLPQVDVGGEYLWGTRKNKDGNRSEANRIQISFIYRIH